MEENEGFWTWIESLSRSMGWEDRSVREASREYEPCTFIHPRTKKHPEGTDCIVCKGSGLATKCDNCGKTMRYSFGGQSMFRHLDTGKEECYSMPFQAHIGDDGGAHHILPGWGKHPDTYEEAPVGDDLEVAHETGDRAKAKLGKQIGRDRSVWFDPDLPEAHLANAHLTITGESGTGKTQAMKTILADLHDYGVPALVLDFKDDYAEPKYAATEGFKVYDPTRRPLPFNPLEPSKDPQTGEANKTFHTYQLVEILGRIYHLGELQQHALREAIKQAYVDAGEGLPTFDQVKAKLEAGKGNGELLGHLAPIFDFGFFSDPDPQGLAQVVSGNTVIRLAQLPGNEVKNSVAEFFLMALYNYLVRLPQTHLLRQILVLDEAWRVVNSPFLEPLMREARAFGLGVFVATQFPTDLPLAVSGSAATDIYFGQSTPDQIAAIQRTVVGGVNGSEPERLATEVRGLLPLTCIMVNKQYSPYVKVEARPYYARGFEPTAAVSFEPENLVLEPPSRPNLNQTKGDDRQVFTAVAKPRGRSHDFEPEDVDSINYFDFEEDMPQGRKEREKWHDQNLDILHQDHGIEVEDLKSSGKHLYDVCGSCGGKGCEYCNNSGLDLEGGNELSLYNAAEKRLNAIGLDTYNSDSRFEVYNGRVQCDEEDCHDEPKTAKTKVAQEVRPSDDGPFICHRCQAGTTNEEGRVCQKCQDLINTFIDFSELTLKDRIDNAKLSAVSRACTLGNHSDCTSKSCNCDHHDIRHQFSGACADGDHDICSMEGCPCGCHDGSIKGQFRCGGCHGSGLTRGLEACDQCGGIGFRGAKLAEMQKFPPGEDDDENSTWAPFSMSEWQMVQGPKRRRGAYQRKTKDCVSCGRRVHENEFPLDSSNNPLVADEYDMEGPDVPQCFLCSNDESSYTFGLDRAKKRKWKPLPPDTPCQACKGAGLQLGGIFNAYDEKRDWQPCWKCNGSGTIIPRSD